MAVGDLTATEQTMNALLTAQETMKDPACTKEQLEAALADIKEAVKRIQEAMGE